MCDTGLLCNVGKSVTQRSHEMALRMALGATRNRVVGLVVSDGLARASAGEALGLVGGFFVGGAMQGILFGREAVMAVLFGTTCRNSQTSPAYLLACALAQRS